MAHDHVEWYTMTYKEIYRLVLWHHDGNSELNEGSKMKVDDNQHGACAVCRARTKEEGGFKDLSMHINLIPMLSDSFRSRFNWSNIFQKGKQIRVSFNISSPAIRGSQGESASQRAQVLRDYFNELEEESIKDPVTHPFHAHSMPNEMVTWIFVKWCSIMSIPRKVRPWPPSNRVASSYLLQVIKFKW